MPSAMPLQRQSMEDKMWAAFGRNVQLQSVDLHQIGNVSARALKKTHQRGRSKHNELFIKIMACDDYMVY